MITRTIDKLRGAPAEPKPEASEGGQYIKSTIYGGLDGIITTFAVVAGVAGASLSSGIVLILGFANLLADGLSMAIGDYLSTQAEVEYADSKRKQEEWAVEHMPDDERRRMTQLYVEKGIAREDAEKLCSIFSKYKSAWVDVIMVEGHGITEERESPFMNAIVTFLSFFVFGLMPLLAYVAAWYMPGLQSNAFSLACLLTAVTLFLLGVQKIRFTKKRWFSSGLEMLIIGGVAAVVAYGIGVLLSGLA